MILYTVDGKQIYAPDPPERPEWMKPPEPLTAKEAIYLTPEEYKRRVAEIDSYREWMESVFKP
jgi:hypothetical protein